jgi:hypothetical protein
LDPTTLRLTPAVFGNAAERLDSPRLAGAAHPVTFLASLWFSLPLRLAGQLGFYDNDYNQLQEHAPSAKGGIASAWKAWRWVSRR